MNFLLRMLGHPHRSPVALRPSGDERHRTAAAAAAARGDLAVALDAYRMLVSENEASIADTLTRAHLHLALNEYSPAVDFFAGALDRLENPPLVTLEYLLDSADEHLRNSRYVRATALLQRARVSVDTLLSAHAGLAVATARMTGSTACSPVTLVPLAELGDLLLRMLARTHLASNLAVSLRQRSLRHDLAPWATSAGSIEKLLSAEFEHLQLAARKHPGHAELHYRLGMVARTLNHLQIAITAFTRVLSLHAHHIPSAARLAATYLQLGQNESVLPLLAVAFAAPPNMLQQYAALADAAQSRAFDKTADQLYRHDPRPAVKANIAFALSELGLLDPARAEWRESVAA